jgi:hypothetical protein
MTVAEFRREVERRRGARRRGAPRYPAELVAFAVQRARSVLAAGRSVNAAATELGLSSMTLSAWLSRSARPGGGRLREVVVSRSPSSGVGEHGLTMTTPSGHVVSGLCVAQAAALLRALS